MKNYIFIIYLGTTSYLSLITLTLNARDLVRDSVDSEVVCMIICPDDIYVEILPSENEAVVNYVVQTPMCTSGPILWAGLPSGSTFPVGTTTNCYQASDSDGNTATCCFDVTVNEAPVICPSDYFATCGSSSDPDITGWPTLAGVPIDPVYDCIEVSYSDNITNSCGEGVQIMRTWTINNTCDFYDYNCTQIIDLTDNESPEIECPNDFSIPCNAYDPDEVELPEVVDACGSDYELDFSDSPLEACNGSGYEILRIWTVTDECDNSASCAMTVEIVCRPTQQAYNISFSNISSTQLTVEWFSGNGTRRIVIMNTMNNFSLPVDGYDPVPVTHYDGSGSQVVYNGTGESVTVTGLSPSTTYWFRVFEASDCSGDNLYITSTATGNPKSQMTSSSQSISWMGIFADDINHPSLGKVMIESTLTSNPSPPRPRICADGSAVTLVKFKNSNTSIQTSSIKFRIASDPSGMNVTKYGFFTNYSVSGDTIIARYNHPTYLIPTSFNLFSFDGIEVVIGNNLIYSYPIMFLRAPIVFVHGLWGNPQTFKSMKDAFIADNLYPIVPQQHTESPLIAMADYVYTNASSFKTNRKQVRTWIDKVLKTTREAEYIAGSVIVIAHSMGGVLSRLYLQSSYADVQYRNDILKLITLNTPHYGSQAANYLFEDNPGLIPFLNKKFSDPDNNGNTQAIPNLRVNSDQILDTLNIDPADQNKVASSTIHSDEEGDNSFYANLLRFYLFISPNISQNSLFGGDIHDLVVARTSQNCHLDVLGTTPEQFHMGSSQNITHIELCKIMLDKSPIDMDYFVNTGFPTDVLPPPFIEPNSEVNSRRTQSDSLIILSPTVDGVYNAGDAITISAQVSHNITRLLLIIEGNSDDINTFETIPLQNYDYTIPLYAVGPLTITLVGGDSMNWLISDSVRINVNSFLMPDSLIIVPENIQIPLGLYTSIKPIGYFSGIQVDLRETTDLDVTYDPEKINYIPIGYIQGIKTGTSNMKFNYKGIIDSVDVIIYNDPSILISGFNFSKNSICVGDSIEFADQSIGLTIGHKWLFPGGIPAESNLANPVIYYNVPGSYPVSLITYFDNGIDSVHIEDVITVHELPEANIYYNTSTSFCQGDSIILIASDAANYSWNNGQTDQNIIVFESGLYSVKITDENGCASSAEPIEVIAYDNPVPVIIPQGPISLCPGDSISLVSETAAQYLWITSDTTQSIDVYTSGNYNVQVIDSNGCFGTSLSVHVEIVDSFIVEIVPSGPLNFCNGDSVVLMASSGFIFSWNSGDTSQSVTIFNSGDFFVEANNSFECTDVSDTLSVIVYPLPFIDLGSDTIISSPYILNAGNTGSLFTWNTGENTQTILADSTGWYIVTVTDNQGCQAYDSVFVEIVTGTISLDENSRLRLYPNPNFGAFTVSGVLEHFTDLQIQVFDLTGQAVYTSEIESLSGTFNKSIVLDDPTPGVYYVVLQLGNRKYSASIFIL